MIKRFGSYISIALAMAAGMTACNDNSGSGYVTEDTGYTSETMYSSTAITSFNLKANSKVLADLDSIFSQSTWKPAEFSMPTLSPTVLTSPN